MKIVNRQMMAITSMFVGITILILENDPITNLTPMEGVAYLFLGIGLFIIIAKTAKRFALVGKGVA